MKQLISFTLICFAVAIAPLAQAQVVTPSAFDFPPNALGVIGGTGGPGITSDGTALGRFDNNAQVVYNASVLAAAGLNSGDVIDGFAFRVLGSSSAPDWTTDYSVRLGTSLNSAGNLDPTLANNRGADYTVVRSGPLSYDGSEYDDEEVFTNVNPNDFGPTIAFDTSFTYTGGDLLLEYSHGVIDRSMSGIVGGSAEMISRFQGVQTQFGRGPDGPTEDFNSFGLDSAPVVRFSIAAAAVPEPSSVALLLGMGIVGMARRRRMV